ncbi:hypothetical protein LZ30DRAFT_763773 [Colletotrichum cereale]|nr:hypothetical protein LZ30DRAFT_763773 [Colletotrichum cereale]
MVTTRAAAGSGAKGACCRAAPPPYDSISCRQRAQHYDSPAWQDLESNVCFLFDPRPPDDETAGAYKPEWEAKLHVKARDVARLMREGFHWTAANLDFETGYIQLDLSTDKDICGGDRWSCSRTFFLSDLSDDSQWTAKLVVYAEKTAVVSSFRITNLTLDTVNWVSAFRKAAEQGSSAQWAYIWDRYESEENFNAIYDDMPLTGWWPWPKPEVDDDDDVTLVAETAERR